MSEILVMFGVALVLLGAVWGALGDPTGGAVIVAVGGAMALAAAVKVTADAIRDEREGRR